MLTVTASANEYNNSVAIVYNTDEGFLQNVKFDLYRIGDIAGKVISPDSKFSNYSVSFDISDVNALTALAETISAYTLRDNLSPDYSDVTSANGVANFGNTGLADGAYLYIGEKHTQYGYIYFCAPAIILLQDGTNVHLEPKYEKVDTTTEIKVKYRVLKAWYTDENDMLKPVEINVQLLCDGEIYDTVTLNETNNWKFEWTGLSAHHSWTITEKFVPEGYVSSLQKDTGVFLLSNITSEEVTTTVQDETTTANDETTTSLTETTTATDETTTQPETTTGAGLPQTGTLSWPVPYVACIGVLLFITGYAIYKKSELTDEQK